MRDLRHLLGLAALAAATASCAAADRRAGASGSRPPGFAARECPASVAAPGARCGTVTVPEDWTRPAGREIALNVVVLPATGGGARLPPLFDIDGGPGLPVTKNAGFYAAEGAAYRSGRDIVLVDQRGTGGSNRLHCLELAASEGEMLPVEQVRRCRDRLAERADLRRYGTAEAVRDLDAVREALGHTRIDLFGLSYGTTVALRYMAEYPQRVRAVAVMGVAPPEAMPPRGHAPAGERALRLLFSDCAADEACRAAFPALEEDLGRAVSIVRDSGGDLTPELFMEKLRTLMYSPAAARQVPYIVSRAALADLGPYRAAGGASGASMIADGMFLSVTCTESFGAMDYEAAAAEARRTLFGDYRLRRQRAACEHWPSGRPTPLRAAAAGAPPAVLLISGRLDPVTPPEWAEAVARRTANARHLVIPYGGHVLDGLSAIDTCLDPLILRFLETGRTDESDGSCLAGMRPPPFRLR